MMARTHVLKQNKGGCLDRDPPIKEFLNRYSEVMIPLLWVVGCLMVQSCLN